MGIGLLRYRQVTGAGPMQPFGLCCPVVPQNPAAVLTSSSSAAVQHWRQQQPGPMATELLLEVNLHLACWPDLNRVAFIIPRSMALLCCQLLHVEERAHEHPLIAPVAPLQRPSSWKSPATTALAPVTGTAVARPQLTRLTNVLSGLHAEVACAGHNRSFRPLDGCWGRRGFDQLKVHAEVQWPVGCRGLSFDPTVSAWQQQ